MYNNKKNTCQDFDENLLSYDEAGKFRDENRGSNDWDRLVSYSDCVTTREQSNISSWSEGDKWLKLLENESVKPELLESEEAYDNVTDDEDKKLTSEETSQPDIMHLPLEKSEYDSEEEEEKGDIPIDWKVNNESQCSLDSICGLNEIKETLYNIFIYPSAYPQFFPKRIRWNQLLLYGPPGTGKTMLANALASEMKAVLYRITSADLLSHWQGQSEKQIRSLFDQIQYSSGTKVLFFDEIDGLFRKRTSDENDNTRRIKTELLLRLDDFSADFQIHQTYLIGATNCPWEIDLSFMRRFHKKIFVPLPDKEARLDIIKRSLESIETDLSDLEWSNIGDWTEGYSGSDLVNVVMTSCYERFMDVKKSKYWIEKGDFWVPANPNSKLSKKINFEDLEPRKIGVRNIKYSDLTEAIEKTPKTIEYEALRKFLKFSEKN